MKSSWKKFKAPTAETEKKINETISKLSLEEKIGLLAGAHSHAKGIPDKGIPELKMSDGPMGAHWFTTASTSYPALIGLAASFDPELVENTGAALARDCHARGIHILLAPGVNIYRSPLCGRNFEYMGEDPFLSSRIAVAYIKGLQDNGIAATVKHFAVNFQEYDRHKISSDLDERTLHEIYLPAFKAAIEEAGSACIMTSYNLMNGIHTSEHPFLINDILKGEWGFDGLAMSDWDSVYDTVNPVNAGLDLEMPDGKFINCEKLIPAVRDGRVKESTIDDKIRRRLRLTYAFGWMEDDVKDPSIPENDPGTAAVSLDGARKSLVLLKNDNGLLPLHREKMKKVAVIGPSSHPAVIGGGGSSYNNPFSSTSIYEGVRKILGESVEVINEPGIDCTGGRTAIEKSVWFQSGDQQGLKAEFFDSTDWSGTPSVTRTDKIVNFPWGWGKPDEKIAEKEYSVRWTGEVRPLETARYNFFVRSINMLYTLKIDGRTVASMSKRAEKDFRKEIKVALKAGRTYRIEFSVAKHVHPNNWVYVALGWEHEDTPARNFQRALDAARSADAVVLAVGFNHHTEGEGADRPYSLDKLQNRLIRHVTALNRKTVMVLTAGGSVETSKWLKRVKALIMSWYPGQDGGLAVAEAIFGILNPSGKLPITWEKRLADRSSYKSYHDTDKDKHVFFKDGIFTGYRHTDIKGPEPLFPFGFGLSYTTFTYENLKLSSDIFDMAKGLTVSFDIVNSGKIAGSESAQIYVRDVKASVPRPLKELKGFVKATLEPGERKTVSCVLKPDAVQFWHPQTRKWTSEPGTFEVLIGANCGDVRLKAEFKL